MKTLSVLLLLALAVGGAWWKLSFPDGTPKDAEAQLAALGVRSREALRDGGAMLRERTATLGGAASDVTAAGGAAGGAGNGTGNPTAEAITATDEGTAQATGATSDRPSDGPSVGTADADGSAARSPDAAPAAGPDAGTDAGPATTGAPAGGDMLGMRLEPLGPSAPDASGRANVVQGRLTDAERRLDAVDGRDRALRERLDALDARLESAAAADARLGDALAALESRVAGLGTGTARAASADGAVPNALSAEAVRAEIRAQLAALIERNTARGDGSGDNPGDGSDGNPRGSGGGGAAPALGRGLADDGASTAATDDPVAVSAEELATLSRARDTGRPVEYKIYFERGGTELSAAAERVLDSFIAQERNRTTGVSIFGFTDRNGSASANRRLAVERSTHVRDYLVANGLPEDRIVTLSGLGEGASSAVLPPDADPAQRRVVMLYAAQP